MARKALKTQKTGGATCEATSEANWTGGAGDGALYRLQFTEPQDSFVTVKKIFKLFLDTFSQFDIIIMGDGVCVRGLSSILMITIAPPHLLFAPFPPKGGANSRKKYPPLI